MFHEQFPRDQRDVFNLLPLSNNSPQTEVSSFTVTNDKEHKKLEVFRESWNADNNLLVPREVVPLEEFGAEK